MSVPHDKPYRRRDDYKFGTEMSGLERPKQFLWAITGVVVVVLALGVVAFIAFG